MHLQEACNRPWMGLYLRFLAVVFAWSALVHFASLLGFGERSWGEMPLAWRIGDVVYAVLDTAIVIGLWKRTVWGVVCLLLAITSQFTVWGVVCLLLAITSQFTIYTAFVDYFAFTEAHRKAIKGLLTGEAAALVLFVLLLILRK